MSGEFRTLAHKLGGQPAWLAWLEIIAALVAIGFALGAIVGYWLAAVTVAGGVALAKRKWPRVRVRDYFRTRKATLPAALVAGGVGAEYALAGVLPAAFPVHSGIPAMLIGGTVAAVATYVVMGIFEGRIMKSVFELVPADQQPELQQFLSGSNPAAGAGGQRADLSKLDPARIAAAIKQRVVGQDEIVTEVVRTTFRRAELVRPSKPLATFLLVGPTGVGKSELAKAIANVLFAGRIINLPLNQMKKTEDVWSIIGPPPGYVGSDRGGKLCRDLARLGTGVLVLDEIEKAHPDIVQALMRLLDEGQLTEQSTGQVYSARGFVIIGTSNAAACEIGEIAKVEQDPDTRAAKVRHALTSGNFPPEIVARFDRIFPFPPLDRPAIAQIVCLMAERHATAAGVELVSVDGALLVDLIQQQEKGADAGMRNLDRAVERAVLDGLLAVRKAGYTRAAIKVLAGKVDVQPVASEAAQESRT